MPLISEAQKKALVRLCAMRGGEGHPWYPIKGLCRVSIAGVLENGGFVESQWGRRSSEGWCDDTIYHLCPTNVGRAYIEALLELEILRAKVDALQGQEQEDEARRRWVEERY